MKNRVLNVQSFVKLEIYSFESVSSNGKLKQYVRRTIGFNQTTIVPCTQQHLPVKFKLYFVFYYNNAFLYGNICWKENQRWIY